MWSSAAHVRFHGVVLCPECRMRAENEDSYGRLWPTAELEEMASLAVVTKSAGGSSEPGGDR